MSAPTKIELELSFDDYLVRFRGYDSEGEALESPQTIEDLIIDIAAGKLVQHAVNSQQSGWDSIRDRVKNITAEEIRARVVPLIEDALSKGFQQTNSYGEPTGKVTTLREVIVAEAQAYLTKPADSYGRDKGTVIQQFIRTEVAKAVKDELDEALKQARADVLGAVRSQAATLITQTITKMAGVS
jgi:hypothetical protein